MNTNLISQAIIAGELVTAALFFLFIYKITKTKKINKEQLPSLEEEAAEEDVTDAKTVSLKDDFEVFKKKTETLQAKEQEIEKIRSQARAADEQLRKKDEAVRAVEQELQKLRSQAQASEAELKKKTETLQAKEQEIEKIRSQVQTAQEQLKKKDEVVRANEAELKKISSQNQTSTAEIKTLQAKIQELEKLRTQDQTVQEQLKKKDDSIAASEAELQKLRLQMEPTQAELKKKTETLHALEEENKEITAKLKELLEARKAGLEQSRKEDTGTKDKLLAAEEELQKLRLQMEPTQAELKKKTETLHALEEENKEITAKLKELLEARKAQIEQAGKGGDGTIETGGDLDILRSQAKAAETELKKKTASLQSMEKTNINLVIKVKDLEAQIEGLNEQIEARSHLINAYKNKIKDAPLTGDKFIEEQSAETHERLEEIRKEKRAKIGEILLANNFITQEVLDKALKYQKEFGGNITQYLLAYGFIDEYQLAQCLCTQFAIPYLPLSSYKIPEDIIKLVPADIAEKYWLIPIDKVGNLLTVVMADPLDSTAIHMVEEATGCAVQPFLGILSEIVNAFEGNYKRVSTKGKQARVVKSPFFVETETYKGPERREAVRFKAEIDISFPIEEQYRNSKTRSVSRTGFLFESDSPLPIGSILTLQINLAKEYSILPIPVVVQVIRIVQLENNKYGIGVKIIKISKQELNNIIDYASTQAKE